MLVLLLSTLLWHSVTASFSYSGCYSNTGVSLAFKNTYPSSPVDQCSALCSDYKYLGIIDGKNCYCGDSQPLSNSVSDANCNSNCTESSPYCGGTGYYAVYANQDLVSSSLSSSSSSFSSTSSESSSSLSSSNSASSTGPSTITISPSSSSSYALVTGSIYNSSSFVVSSTYVNTSTSSISSLSHSHRSATTSLSSDQTVLTSDSEYVENGVTITSAVLLTTQKGSDVELTRTADNVVSSSVTLVSQSKSAGMRSQVAGGVVGGTAGISMICFLVWYYTRRVKQKDEEEKQRNLATIAATMASKNLTDLSHSGTVHGKVNSSANPFSPRSGTIMSKPSTKRGLAAADDEFNFMGGQGIMRMGSTGRESTVIPMRMGSTGHEDDHNSYGESTLGSFTSASSDGYYAQKMATANAVGGQLSRNTSSATASTARYSFASFESRGIIVDDEIAESIDAGRDDGSIMEDYQPQGFGLTIANPDNESDSDDEHGQQEEEHNGRLRVLF
ncbi:hypothetical protein DASC09_012910 [Saccharomycopsis crataegensis]|uniref:WSC domain-containing protein n=1 Tax=Saccharomycopsis crataegensis TaxID=43959 RepID=A0AAV5QGX7_9ASCO|nr:hypothetical protein DASC09_012910 [Saccharomycopsis crataegensis]